MISSPEKQEIASQLLEMRAYERRLRINPEEGDKPENWDRDMYGYLFWLNGLTAFLNHARSLGRGSLILDLGAGTTRGISEIASSAMGQGLNFEATVLSNRPEIKDNLGLEKTHITSAESLRGIATNSVSAIIALNSLSYSAAPHIAIKRIDDVLVPGGLIKAAFKVKEGRGDDSIGELNYQPHDYFSMCLRDLGYDVAISDLESEEILVAIKPGANVRLSAKELLRIDSGVLDIGMKVDGHY